MFTPIFSFGWTHLWILDVKMCNNLARDLTQLFLEWAQVACLYSLLNISTEKEMDLCVSPGQEITTLLLFKIWILHQ